MINMVSREPNQFSELEESIFLEPSVSEATRFLGQLSEYKETLGKLLMDKKNRGGNILSAR